MFKMLSSWQAIVRVSSVHLMNADWCQVATTLNQVIRLGNESDGRLLPSISTVIIYYYYS